MKRINFPIIAIATFIFMSNGNAAQFISVSDGIEISATVSLVELNRLRVEGSKIDGIRVAKGVIEYSRDEKSGDLFINLVRRSYRPINIFLTSDTGSTFKLLLIPKDIPAEQIFLIERAAKNGVHIFDDYQDKLTKFYKSLYDGTTLKDYKISNSSSSNTVGDLKVTLKSSYIPAKPDGFRGDIYEVKNKSKETQTINPQDFYHDGIKAIKFDSYTLNSKEITKMYVISMAE